jgi:hypothetical protein
MDHPTYLERHHELTSAALATLHLQLAKGEYDEATAYLADVRAQTDVLWQARVADAQQTVSP